MNKLKKLTLVLVFATALVNTTIAETVSTIERDDPQGILYAFQRFVEIPVDIIVDSLAQNGKYIVFEVFTGEDEKNVYDEKDYDPYGYEHIDENDLPEIWKSAYYLMGDMNAIIHEYTCRRYCGGNTKTVYRLLPYAHGTKFMHYALSYATNDQCIGDLSIYDFNPITEKFSLDTIYDVYNVTIENFFKESTPDSLMEFDYCFLLAYDITDKYIAQYRFRSGLWGYIEERSEELRKWMLGNVIDIYFVDGKLVRSEPYFEDNWQFR